MRWSAAALVTVLALAGCATAAPSEPVPLDDLAHDQFDEVAGVHGVEALLVAPDDDEPTFSLNVVMVLDVTSDQLVDIAAAVRGFATSHEDDADITAIVTVAPFDHDGESDTTPIIPLRLDLYPNLRSNASEDARQLIAAYTLPGVQQVSIAANQVYVEVATAADIAGVLDELRGLDLWSNGGRVTAELGRVRITDVPERLTTDGMRAILQLAETYPAGQFWLEAPNDDFQVQALFIDSLTQPEAEAVAATLGDPNTPAFVREGIELEWVVSWIDGEGRHDLAGTLTAGV